MPSQSVPPVDSACIQEPTAYAAPVSTPLPRSTPSAQGIDPAAVLAFVDAVDADPTVEVHALMLLRHGHVVAEGCWSPHTPERTRLLYSLSKSFTATALGFAVQEGLVGLDDPAVSHFPELSDVVTDPRSRAITVSQLAAMASGHDREMWDEAVRRDWADPVRGFLTIPPDEDPGTLFAYSQPCTFTVASIIQRAAGTGLTQYLRPRLLDPLGIGDVGWQAWPGNGVEAGFSGLFARVEDVAKLGLLYLQGGRWGDTQLIPRDFVDLATARRIATPADGNPDWAQGYGLGFWMSRHGYRGDGAFGQFCVVLPKLDTVVAITAGTENMQGVLDHVWEHLLPGFGDGRPDDAAQADLQRRLAALALPTSAARFNRETRDGWTSTACALVDDGSPDGAAWSSVEARCVDGRLELTITEASNVLTFPVGLDGWVTSEQRDARGDVVPVAASGGWLDEHTLRVEAVFLETPHRIDITLTPAARAAVAVWRGTPLNGGVLETLHRPR